MKKNSQETCPLSTEALTGSKPGGHASWAHFPICIS